MLSSNTPLVSIIVLNHNGRDVLKPCLESIFKTKYSPFEVIVIDNGSTDGSENVAREFDVKLIKNGSNLGYCKGNNEGIRNSSGEYVVLLNNDTVVDENWLRELVRGASCMNVAFCQPKILMLDYPKVINSTGIDLHVAGFGILKGLGEVDEGQYDEKQEIFAPHGTCIFASKRAIKEIGLLDENFFIYNEDTDWGWRARLLKWKVLYVPSAIVYHKWGHTVSLKNPKKFYLLEKNRLTMLLTNLSRRSLVLLSPVLLLTEILVLGYLLLNGLLGVKIKVYSDLIRLRRYIHKRRNRIQTRRRAADKTIAKNFTYKITHIIFGRYVLVINSIYKQLFRTLKQFF